MRLLNILTLLHIYELRDFTSNVENSSCRGARPCGIKLCKTGVAKFKLLTAIDIVLTSIWYQCKALINYNMILKGILQYTLPFFCNDK